MSGWRRVPPAFFRLQGTVGAGRLVDMSPYAAQGGSCQQSAVVL